MLVKLVKKEVEGLESGEHKHSGSGGKGIHTATTGETYGSHHRQW